MRVCFTVSTHYYDVTMSAVASKMTNISTVCSTLCPGAHQRNAPKLRVTGLCEANPLVTCCFVSQKASNAINVSIWWRHHGFRSWLGTKQKTSNKLGQWWPRSFNHITLLGDHLQWRPVFMKTTWHENVFHITDPLWGKSIRHWWVSSQGGRIVELWISVGDGLNKLLNSPVVGDLWYTYQEVHVPLL